MAFQVFFVIVYLNKSTLCQGKIKQNVHILQNFCQIIILVSFGSYKVISFPDIQQNFHSSSLAIIFILMLDENLYILQQQHFLDRKSIYFTCEINLSAINLCVCSRFAEKLVNRTRIFRYGLGNHLNAESPSTIFCAILPIHKISKCSGELASILTF